MLYPFIIGFCGFGLSETIRLAILKQDTYVSEMLISVILGLVIGLATLVSSSPMNVDGLFVKQEEVDYFNKLAGKTALLLDNETRVYVDRQSAISELKSGDFVNVQCQEYLLGYLMDCKRLSIK
jgi:hypothetical protein